MLGAEDEDDDDDDDDDEEDDDETDDEDENENDEDDEGIEGFFIWLLLYFREVYILRDWAIPFFITRGLDIF